MSSNNYILPKVETILKNENRLFDCSFYGTLDDAFEALQAFISDSYSLGSNEQFLVQYKDDDNDMITISSVEDFQEAIEEANSKGEILKLYVILQQNNGTSQNPTQLTEQENENHQENKNENDKENEKLFANDILNDLRNNKVFREEMISFIKTALILFQQNHSNPDYDLATCILTSLSSYETLMEHETLQHYVMNLLPFITTRIQPFSSFLMSIDANTAGIWISQMIESWASNSQPPIFSPFYQIISSILQAPSANELKTDEKDKKQQQHASNPSTPSTQPIISSSITDEFSYTKQGNTNGNDGKSYPKMPPFGLGSLLSTLLAPPQSNDHNVNVNSNQSDNKQHNRHPLFVGPQWLNNHQWPHRFHNYGHNNNYDSNGLSEGCTNSHNESSNIVSSSCASSLVDEDMKLCVVKDDSTLSDEAVVLPNQILIKTWRIKNIGKKEIGNGLYVKYVGNVFNPMINGVQFPIAINNDKQVLSINEETDVSVTIESPSQNGHYSSEWKIFNNDGKPFDLLLTINLNVCSENNVNEIKSDANAANNVANSSNDVDVTNTSHSSKNENEQENKNKKEENSNQLETNIDPYAKQLQLLLEMGFTNVDMLRNLLASHNGLVDDVINLLS